MNHTKHRSEESIEDYLETILSLQQNKSQVRSIDIAKAMNFSKPSVSVAMKNLRERGYISVSGEGFISLTDTGRERAESTLERHNLIANWLMELGVSQSTALDDACKIEHDLSDESFEAIKQFILQK